MVKTRAGALVTLSRGSPPGLRPGDAVGDPYLGGGRGSGRYWSHLSGQQRLGLLACGCGHVLHHHVPSAGLHPVLQGVQQLRSCCGSDHGNRPAGAERRAAPRPPTGHTLPWLSAGRRGKDDPVLPLPYCYHALLHAVHPALLMANILDFQQGSAAREVGRVQGRAQANVSGPRLRLEGGYVRAQTDEHHELLKRPMEAERRRLQVEVFAHPH